MKVIRKSVFETNSSSTHSITIEQKNLTEDELSNIVSIPINKNKDKIIMIDILGYPLSQDGITYGSLGKLRVAVSLITECIFYEFEHLCHEKFKQIEHPSMHNSFDYFLKAIETESAKKFVLQHKYWGYLNTILKQKYGINISIYAKYNRFPFVDVFVDDNLGCETCYYFSYIGLKENMSAAQFREVMIPFICDDTISCYQNTFCECY